MKIACMSDLHGYLCKPEDIPECDVVCICGDIVPLDYQDDMVKSIAWFCLEFVPWTDSLRCKKVIFIAGNHDFWLEYLNYYRKEDGTKKERSGSDILKKLLPGNNKSKHKLVYLKDSSIEVDGKVFYGTPWITDLPGWAFNISDEDFEERLERMPNKFDVLLTHMPPRMLDLGTVLQSGRNYLRNFGSDVLVNTLVNKDIKYAFCGHVHSGNHALNTYKEGNFAANVSLKDEDYRVNYQPLVIEI